MRRVKDRPPEKVEDRQEHFYKGDDRQNNGPRLDFYPTRNH